MSTINLHRGDCLERMAEIQDCCIDLTVTSPPYDNLRTYAGSLEWGEHIWKPFLSELYRITKDGGVVVWVVGDATIKGSETGTSFKQALWAMECGFRLHDTMIYKRKTAPLTHNRYEQAFEYMFVFSKGKPSAVNHIRVDYAETTKHRRKTKYINHRRREGENKKTATHTSEMKCVGIIKQNVWEYTVGNGQSTTDRAAFIHPAIFPEKLAADHITSWSNPGDTVFDPFMGSGTTGKMAKQLGRDFIGIEKVPEYFKIAQDRIADCLL